MRKLTVYSKTIFYIVNQGSCLNLRLWCVMQVGLWVIHVEVHGYVINWNWGVKMETGKEKIWHPVIKESIVVQDNNCNEWCSTIQKLSGGN